VRRVLGHALNTDHVRGLAYLLHAEPTITENYPVWKFGFDEIGYEVARTAVRRLDLTAFRIEIFSGLYNETDV